MRILEAQEAERSHLGQEIHDGPAQALANAIFQVEYLERLMDTDTKQAHAELSLLRELLRRELGAIRAFITQLRPATVDELGLEGAIDEVAGPPEGALGADGGDGSRRADASRADAAASERSCCAWPRKPCRMCASTPARTT